MSALVLVRHGQARAFEPDSDRLTDRGEEQARVLGAHLLSEGVVVDEVITGTLMRQVRTAEIVGDVYRARGMSWPVPRVNASWNEYAAEGILGTLLPELAARDGSFEQLVREFHEHAASPDRNRYFQRMFESLMRAWQQGSVVNASVEAFTDFHGRVRRALLDIIGRAGSGRTLVFTSGGPIGTCVQEILRAPAENALTLNWRVKNASLTEFLFSSGRISLEHFNSVTHLPPELRTFR